MSRGDGGRKELRVCYIIESSPLINTPLSSLRWLAKPETLSCSWGGRARHVSKAGGLVWLVPHLLLSSPVEALAYYSG
jgi:hypothetical protein